MNITAPGQLHLFDTLQVLTNDIEKIQTSDPVLSPRAMAGYTPAVSSYYDGDKFAGGFGVTELFTMDYWTLRARSSQLFTENLFASGLIKRLITNEINIGLAPDVMPDEGILGVPDSSLDDWTEMVENRFDIWAKNAVLCDVKRERTLGAIFRAARLEALISGDVLVVVKTSPATGLPLVDLISGQRVQTPLMGNPTGLSKNHIIRDGVELNPSGAAVAYWIKSDAPEGLFKYNRLPAMSPRTGRRNAWLYFGVGKRLENVRGDPLLGVVLQSLKELDRYRDNALRKSVVNSIMAMFIKKTEDKPGTLPMTNGATINSTIQVSDDGGSSTRNLTASSNLPGLVAEELQHGEEPVLLGGSGTDTNYELFEKAVVSSIAWYMEMPPEIATLSFSSNYSASQAAINEFKSYLRKVWVETGDTLATPLYVEWLLSEVLLGKIEAKGLLEAWRDPQQYDTFGAWVAVQWYGTVKPSTDMVKQGKASQILVDNGWSTNARESRGINGSKFTKNAKQLIRENELKVEMARPFAQFKAEFGETPDDTLSVPKSVDGDTTLDDIISLLEDGEIAIHG